MRGVFTSGVLDAFMKHELYFHYVVAVSAGACNGMSYISRQPRRARLSNIDFLSQYNYLGLRYLFTQGSILDKKLLYDRFPNKLIPFDYDEFFKHAANFEMVTTNCLTGRPEYLSETSDHQRAINIVMASSSLPFVSKMVTVDGVPMLDGGITDSIPFQHARDMGHPFNVVVSTRNYGYRESGRDRKIPPLHLSSLSPFACGVEPSHRRLQRTIADDGRPGACWRHSGDTSSAPHGSGPHREGHPKVGASLRGRLPVGRGVLR